MHGAITAVSMIGFALAAGGIGGWVIAAAPAVPSPMRAVHRVTGALFLVISASSLNRTRLEGLTRGEDWTITALRVVATVLGVAVLAMHAHRAKVRNR